MVVVTNNPLMKNEPDTLFIEGPFRDVLVKARDMVYEGYELVTHPLFASLGMMWSPYRTVILGEKRDKATDFEIETVENSIHSYDQIMDGRRRLGRVYTQQVDDDYAWMDRSLYLSALEEQGMIQNVSQ